MGKKILLPSLSMKLSDFHFNLPEDLIAQQPPKYRGDSRLLSLDGSTGQIKDVIFDQLPLVLNTGDLLIMNDTRVIAARLFGQKLTGGKVEILIERQMEDGRFLAQIKSSKSPKTGTVIELEGGHMIEVLAR